MVWVRKIKKEAIPELDKIKDQVKKDYIFEKKDKVTLEVMNDIVDNNNNDTLNKMKYIDNTRKFILAKKDLITQSDNKDVKEIMEKLKSYEILNEVLSTLHKNDSKYYKISENEYALVYVSDIDQPKQASNTILYMLNKYLNSGVSNDIVILTKKEFKTRQKIKKNNKVIDERTNVVN